MALCLLAPAAASAQDMLTLHFDGAPGDAGNGDTDFSIGGTSWSGGEVRSFGQPPFYASGAFSYVFGPGGVVTFEPPADLVDFFFVHGGAVTEATATARDELGASLGSVSSNPATGFGDSANFEMLDPVEPIASLEFTGGVVDDFMVVFAPEPAAAPAQVAALVAIGALSRASRRAARALAARGSAGTRAPRRAARDSGSAT